MQTSIPAGAYLPIADAGAAQVIELIFNPPHRSPTDRDIDSALHESSLNDYILRNFKELDPYASLRAPAQPKTRRLRSSRSTSQLDAAEGREDDQAGGHKSFTVKFKDLLGLKRTTTESGAGEDDRTDASQSSSQLDRQTHKADDRPQQPSGTALRPRLELKNRKPSSLNPALKFMQLRRVNTER